MTRRTRRIIGALIGLILVGVAVYQSAIEQNVQLFQPQATLQQPSGPAAAALATLEIKGRAPKTGYSRDQFGDGWGSVNGCSVRQVILYRDFQQKTLDDTCRVISGSLLDPYTGVTIIFTRDDADAVQIDHVVALSDAWQKGAQQLSQQEREQLANDPLELLAVDGPSNQAKGDSDAASWLPPMNSYRCSYVARQIAVKQKYRLWVTSAEQQAMSSVLNDCPDQALPAA